ncbi:MAG: methyltransferase domain-containing protein [Acidimicrobiia bacterium]|nr:methyltransferase domain-containing protein [Acidimicrobiia bacterium]
MRFAPGSRGRLTRYDLDRFPGDSLFDRLGRVVCSVGRLPRKELYEAWELGRRVRRRCRGGRVVDVAGGHGLLAHVMLLLDDSSPEAVVVDPDPPPAAAALHQALVAEWPRLNGRVSYLRVDVQRFVLTAGDLVVSSHACGALTDAILDAAAEASAAVAVLPCCHDLATCDPGPLAGWMERTLAVDAVRALRLETRGYAVSTQTIPAAVTPKNRLLIARRELP